MQVPYKYFYTTLCKINKQPWSNTVAVLNGCDTKPYILQATDRDMMHIEGSKERLFIMTRHNM